MRQERRRNFFKAYKIGVDLWAILLFALVMLPNIVAFSVPKFSALLDAETGTLEITATVFQVIFVALLIFIVHEGKRRLNFRSPLVILCGGALVCYYVAWICLFCAAVNAAVYLALAIFPCVAFLVFEVERRNFFALVPTAVFSILHLISSCIAYLA